MTTTTLLGCGFAGAGTSFAGYGTPATQSELSRQDLVIDEGPGIGLIGDCRLIDPVTQDYKYNSNGYFVGGLGIQQKVYLALMTIKGSSAITNLGQTYSSIKVIGSNFNQQITSAVSNALANLVSQKQVSIVAVNVNRFSKNGLSINVQWQDLTTGKTFTTVLV